MKKRTFLKLSSAMVAGAAISPLVSWEQDERLKNWAGNLTYSTGKVDYPTSVEQIRTLVKQYDKLKVLGTRHCFNTIADSRDRLLSMKAMNKILFLDTEKQRVSVEPGVTYGQLGPYLNDHGYALHNLASLPHISVAGACITATHGSGVKNQNLSSAVTAIEFVRGDGELQKLTKERDGESFNAAVVGLGAIGVLTKVELAIEPTFLVRQDVYQNLPMQELRKHFDEILSGGYSVSLFTDWQQDSINEVWVKSKIAPGEVFTLRKDYFGAHAATKNLHPISSLSAENCTEQMGVAGPWFDRLPHFKMGFTPSSGVELQAEYFVAHAHALEAIQAVARLGKQVGPQLMITEIRTIAADELWMSPCYQQPSVTIHFTWKQNWPEVSKLLFVIEKELAPFQPKPHWGKLFNIEPGILQSRYGKLSAFKEMVKAYDPAGKFRNDFLAKNLY